MGGERGVPRGMGWRLLLRPIIRPNRQCPLGWSFLLRQSMRTDPNLKLYQAVIVEFRVYACQCRT